MQSMGSNARPVVGVPACLIDDGEHRFHRVSDKYIQAVVNGTGCTPLLIPALGDWLDFGDMVDRLDGLFLTGSPSNVEPHRYGGTPSREGTAHDPFRDATTLPLIRAAVAGGLPLFAVCRGIQELNVGLGGTLHPTVHA